MEQLRAIEIANRAKQEAAKKAIEEEEKKVVYQKPIKIKPVHQAQPVMFKAEEIKIQDRRLFDLENGEIQADFNLSAQFAFK